MSSRASIFYSENTDTHIYEETNESQAFWGRFQGYNIYACIDQLDLLAFKIEGNYFIVRFVSPSEITKQMGISEWKIWGDDVSEVEYDADGLLVSIKGGSTFAKKLSAKKLHLTDREFFLLKEPTK